MNPNTLLLPNVWPRAVPATIAHCVMLALLVHVWLVLTLGNAPGGTARPGEGVWGAVNVTLRGPETPAAAAVPTIAVPAAATGPEGQADTPRWGGAVRAQTAPELPPEPGAAQLGNWAPLPPTAAAEPALTPLPRAPVVRSNLPAGPLPEPGRVVEERAPEPTPSPERTLASSLGRPLAPAVAAAALPTTPSVAPVPGRLPELSAPLAAPLMAPRVAPPPVAATVAALPSTQPAAVPYVVAEPPAVALKQLVAAPQPVAALPPTLTVPAALPPTLAAPAPASVTPSVAAPLLPPAISMASPVTAGLPTGGAPAGKADASTRLGHDVAGAAALPASAPPRLNLQLARPRGGEISRGMGGGVLAVLPRPPEVDEKLGQQIAKSAKVDCRSAYAAAGLLAVVPLAAEALRKDGSCKW